MSETRQEASLENYSNLEQALNALANLHPKKIDLGLERIETVLARLGNPQEKLPPTVHIAGTNGKGSTVAFLRSIAQAQGLRVHVYTSPHLVRFNERIVVASNMISDEALIDVLARVRAANAGEPLSFFEATTAAAFLAFSETPADLCIIEVGLGGRFDATNVIDTPAAVGITPVDLDHAEFLGRDIAKIAREKAGIMKWHAPVFIGAQTPKVAAVLEAEANRVDVEAQIYGQDYRTYISQGRMVFENAHTVMDLPLPGLIGDHQLMNAGLAIAIAEHLKIAPDAIANGIAKAQWAARLQPLTKGPLADIVSKAEGELWLDGGHNPHAAKVIASAMSTREAKVARPLILVMAILANKDAGGFLDAFKGLASGIVATHIPGHTSLAPETLLEIAQNRGIRGNISDSIEEAVAAAVTLGQSQFKDEHDNPPRILICGSLYLAGDVLRVSGLLPE